MRRTIIAVLLLTLAAGTALADAAPSPWFSEVRGSALKTVDLDAIGVGLSVNVYQWAPGRALWLDGCPIYDGSSNILGGFAGLSTEVKGNPALEFVLAPIINVIDTAGVGCKVLGGEATVAAYVTTHF